MSNQDTALLAQISYQSYFRLQPQPLVDLLNKRGIVGRPAEVFWTYFHWGFQNGSFSCQLSSAFIAKALFTDLRTVQRANERLMAEGLIMRERMKRTYGTHLEAPAVTTVTIPDDEVRNMFASSPVRPNASGSRPAQREAQTKSNPNAAVPVTTPPQADAEFTSVNSSQSPELSVTHPAPAYPQDARDRGEPDRKERPAPGNLSAVKNALPPELKRLHDLCVIKATPGIFRTELAKRDSVSDVDAATLLEPIIKVLEVRQRDMSDAQSKKPLSVPKERRQVPPTKSKRMPDEPRPIPSSTFEYIQQRVMRLAHPSLIGPTKMGTIKEIVYSITIGTLRGLDLNHAVNTAVKLICDNRWSRPKGMPDGWIADQYILATA
jgi:hypothetical protein